MVLSKPTHNPKRFGGVVLGLALAGAIAFRIYLIFANDFPINDGALFLEFIREISVRFPALPTTISYNELALPFAYPPLSFWVAASLTKLGLDSLAVVRVMPIIMNIFYVLLFALVLLKSKHSQFFTAISILFLSTNLRSFEWLLMGGGMSRGLGSLFLMLTLLAATAPSRPEREAWNPWRMALAGAAVAGAILSHLEWGILAAGAVVLSRGLARRSFKAFAIDCLISGGTALAIVFPWLLHVQQSYGLAPFLAAGTSSGWSPAFMMIRLLEVAILATMMNPFVIVGAVVLMLKRRWFWLGFALLCAILTPRHAPTPLALATSVFAAQGIVSAYHFSARYIGPRRVRVGVAAAVIGFLLSYAIYRSSLDAPRSFATLPPKSREAMAWVAANHPGARFAIINEKAWHDDNAGEWFPTLARARSVTTVQGREWNGQFVHWEHMYRALRASRNCAELESALEPFGSFDFVWAETMQDCLAPPRYRPVFRNDQVSIYRVRN